MKSPAFQFYPKQWLGDDKVMAMSWNARAMHMHLMCIAWQQDPPCTLPDDDRLIRRWLGNPRGWEDFKSEIFAAWKMQDGRWVQSGLLAQFNRQRAYSETRKSAANARWGKNAYASAMQCENDALQSSSSTSSEIQEQVLLPEAAMQLPASGGKTYSVTTKQVEHWKELFPAVDVMQNLRGMVAWLEANPRNRKTTSGMNRFIVNWLGKEQNRAPKITEAPKKKYIALDPTPENWLLAQVPEIEQ